jgi:Ca2+-binding RTX toxin-like protein
MAERGFVGYRSGAIALGAVLALATPGVASAALVQSGLYRAASGEVNTVTLTAGPGGNGTAVEELTAPLTLGPGCTAGVQVVCDPAVDVVRLGDRDDFAVHVNPFISIASVYGGRGNDDILSDALGAEAFGGAGDDDVEVSSNGFSDGFGGPGDDVVRGSGAALVRLHGNAGDDHITSDPSGALMELLGGTGDDEIVIRGGDNAITTAAGGPGSDIITAVSNGGGELSGGAGDDRLTGSAAVETFRGGPGRDSLESADGVGESIACGAGQDSVAADAFDTVASDCENVTIL